MEKRKIISVVTPCYNEEFGIARCHDRVKEIFDKELSGYEREHIFCDNCSTDKTLDVLKEIAKTDAGTRIIANACNYGVIRNNYNGIMSAGGDAAFLFMPADLQDPPELMPRFVKKWEEGYDLVYGIRADRIEGCVMKFIRKSYYRLFSKVSNIKMPLNVGDYQLVDRKVLEAMRRFDDVYPHIRVMAFQCTSRSIGIPYVWQKRQFGFSKNSMVDLLDQGLNGIISVSSVPTRLALVFGVLMAIVSVGYALFTFFVSLFFGTPAQAGIPTLITGLFFLNGLVMATLGLLGEYILAIHAQVRRKPMVVERERINFPEKTVDAGQR